MSFDKSCEIRKVNKSISLEQSFIVTVAFLDQFAKLECHNTRYSLKIYINFICSESTWNVEKNLNYQPCPNGFYLNCDENECVCDCRLKNFLRNTERDIDDDSIVITTGWFSYKDRFIRFHTKCPLNYSLKQNNFFHIPAAA